jgi:predicted DsbA family dithiol-disulfide isomerase
VRWRRLEEEYGDRIELEWKSYLLRPTPRDLSDRVTALEKFRRYTRGWERVAADPDAGEFNVWASDEGPPSHSIPAHLVSKAAQQLGRDAFGRIHERLMRAYFQESRDISRSDVLLEMWLDAGLPEEEFARADDPALLQAVIDDHNEALGLGATGVPAARLDGNPAVIVGAHPVDLYRTWIERTLTKQAAEA